MNANLSFEEVNAAALSHCPGLVESWLPGGMLQGSEYVCGDVTGGEGDSCKVNWVSGKWADFATNERGGDLVSLYAASKNIKQGEAARVIAEELRLVDGRGQRACKPCRANAWVPISPVPPNAPAPVFDHRHLGKPTATWEYNDPDGNLLSYTCRFEGKDGKKDLRPFTFCRGPGGQEEWRCAALPEPRPLYGLDKLARVKADVGVMLVEGEKSADAATRLLGPELVCMTWPNGSNSVGKTDFSPLAGHAVTIWPDADEPGFRAALALGARLKVVGAASVAIIVPPTDVEQGWDLADAEAEGWTADTVAAHAREHRNNLEQFQRVAKERFRIDVKSETVPPHTVKKGLNVINVNELLSMVLPERGHVLKPVIPEQGLAMLYAPRGLGKTWVALSIACAVASGQAIFGSWKAEEARHVLYLDGEMPAVAIQERLASILAGCDMNIHDPDYLRILTPDLQTGFMPNIATPDGQDAIEPFLKDVALVVVDNIATLGRAGRENEAEGWLPVQEWLLRLRRAGIAVLLVHHAGKSGGQRGTSSREDILDTVIAMKRPEDYKAEEGARFEVHLEKARGFCGNEAKAFEASLRLDNNRMVVWTTRQIEDVRLARVQELKALGMSEREIAEETGITKSTVHNLLKR